MILLRTVLITLALSLGGCGQPTIDGSSKEAMKESIKEIQANLDGEKKNRFEKAVQVLVFSGINLKDLFAAGQTGGASMEADMLEKLDGKTADEVIAEADKVLEARREKEREQALQEIKELEAKKKKAAQAGEKLKDFEVVRSRFHIEEGQFQDQPIISLSVKNGTSESISRAYFKGVIASPDRAVPWLEETFNYEISGGLEPGETADWELAPNPYMEWGQVDAPDDAVFTAEVYRLDGADGEKLYSTDDFSENDAERLQELKKEYGQ